MLRLLHFWLFPILVGIIICACAPNNSVSDPDELGRTLDNALLEIPVIYLNKGNSIPLGGYFKDVKPEFGEISAESFRFFKR